MAELRINHTLVELGSKRLVFSKAGYSFTDWLTKDIAYSERITLPETSVLNSIFARPQAPEIATQKFSKLYTFTYSDYGKVVFSGIAKLEAFNENREYEIQLLDSSFELFENLKSDLNQLSVDQSDFIFNTTNYDTLKVLNSSIWLWSIASFHESKTLAKIPPTTLAFSRPFFSVKRLVELMLAENGWSYNLSNESAFFDELIISAKNEFVFTSYEKLFDGIFTTGNLTMSGEDFSKSDGVGTTTLTLTYNSKFRLRGNANADNDFLVTISSSNQTETFVINSGSSSYDITSNEFEASDIVSISIYGVGNLTLDNFLIYTIIDENDFGNISLANFTGFKVKTYDNLPEIVQKELFKHCLVTTGSFFSTDNLRKQLNINSVVSLSKLSAKDWSTKFVEGTETITPLSGYGKTNYYQYSNSDEKPTNLGRGVFAVENEVIEDVKDIYTSIFEASTEVVINSDTIIDNTVYDDVERINEIDTLLGYYDEIGAYTVARFANISGNLTLSNYYRNFVLAIQGGEMIEASFNLNKSDFFLFDFTQLVYIENFKSTFYVLKIGDYSDNSLTDVILLKT